LSEIHKLQKSQKLEWRRKKKVLASLIHQEA
jgi:hypothetical protein